MTRIAEAKALLKQKFAMPHVDALLNHFSAAVEKYAVRDWDGVALKSGKFVEAVTKALMVYCGKTIGAARQFKAGQELRQLEGLPAAQHPETVRIVIPKACIFVYEVVNNRGGRHDAHDLDANEMDAKGIVPTISWVLAEMVRFCSTDADTASAMAVIQELTNKTYPYFEEIDGRAYVNIRGLKPGDIALLLLYRYYPQKIGRQQLIDLVVRHGHKKATVNTAVHRLKNLVDDDDGEWKLRALGRERAESLLREALA
jgi:hypothetical protein